MYFSRILVVFLGLACVFSSCTQASEEAPVSAPFGLDASLLIDAKDSFQMNMVSPEAVRPVGTAHAEVKRSLLNGRAVINLVLVQELGQGTMRDSLVVDASTLLPIDYVNSFPNFQSIHTTYATDGQVHSEIERMDVQIRVDTLLSGPHLDAAAFTSLLPAFPFEPTMDLRLPVFHYEKGAMTYGVKVVGDESITTCLGNHDTWKVETESSSQVSQHWVDKKTRRVVQVVVDLGEGRRFEQTPICTE
ncbi:hypothetical protein HQ496_02330 [bacterium]|nr:hypothetical protein [bacterium]